MTINEDSVLVAKKATSLVSNKVIWLTGGSSGIGLALLKKLLAMKAIVIVTGRNIERLEDLRLKYENNLFLIKSDFSSDGDLKALRYDLDLKMQQHALKSIDILILNAGVCEYVDANALDLSIFKRMIQINFYAAIACTEIALPYLKKSISKPLLVGISSLSTQLPFTQAQAYGASKAAFSYFLESMRVDLQDTLDISVLSPGFVKTPLTDQNTFEMPFLISSEKAADFIIRAIKTRPLSYKFPKRFSSMLTFMSYFPKTWLLVSRRMNEKRAESSASII